MMLRFVAGIISLVVGGLVALFIVLGVKRRHKKQREKENAIIEETCAKTKGNNSSSLSDEELKKIIANAEEKQALNKIANQERKVANEEIKLKRKIETIKRSSAEELLKVKQENEIFCKRINEDTNAIEKGKYAKTVRINNKRIEILEKIITSNNYEEIADLKKRNMWLFKCTHKSIWRGSIESDFLTKVCEHVLNDNEDEINRLEKEYEMELEVYRSVANTPRELTPEEKMINAIYDAKIQSLLANDKLDEATRREIRFLNDKKIK